MKKILFSIACAGALQAQSFMGVDFIMSQVDKHVNYSDNNVYQGSVFLNTYKLSDEDSDFVFSLDASLHSFSSEYKIDSRNYGKHMLKYTNINALGGLGFFNDYIGVKHGVNLLAGFGHEILDAKIRDTINATRYKNNYDINTNLFKLGLSSMSAFDTGLLLEASVFGKFYLDEKRDVIFDKQQRRLNVEANLMLGYSFYQELNSFYGGVKIGYANDIINKGIRYGVVFGYSF